MDAASFPLSTGTYSLNGRKYRKTAYQLKTQSPAETAETFEDTPDVYDDEPGCLAAPPGLPALKKKVAKAAVAPKPGKHAKESNEPVPTEDDRVKVIGGKKWIASIAVPACFIGKLIGTNRRALNSLENDTQCRVKTPRRDDSSSPCEITSLISLECVQRCLDRIEIFVDDARKSARVTHFVAFPCDQHEVQENYRVFQQLIMDSEQFDASCKNSQLFTKPSRLHLTLSVARIFDDVDLQKAKDAFRILEDELKTFEPLIADIQGIDMMNDDPSQVSVLYAKVGGDNIQKVANHVARRLLELGVTKQTEEDVKLHMTLMNVRYVTQKDRKAMTSFDAKKILEDLKESYFGTVRILEICLCPLSSNVPTAEGKFYEKSAVIKMP